MEEFLKKHSTVPNWFLEDFFSIAKESYDEDAFIIDFDLIVKWLSVKKGNLKRLLVSHFKENIDYTITTEKVMNINGPGSNNVERIKLKPFAFKLLCLDSRAKKARMVQEYFAAIESLIRKYYKTISDDIEKKLGLKDKEIDMLKNNQKTKYNSNKGIVYILKALNSTIDLYKIGKSKNFENRLNGYNSGNANDIEPLFVLEVDDITEIENCVKSMIMDSRYRSNKEVYEADLNVLKKLIFECDKLRSRVKNKFFGEEGIETNKKFKQVKQNGGQIIICISKK